MSVLEATILYVNGRPDHGGRNGAGGRRDSLQIDNVGGEVEHQQRHCRTDGPMVTNLDDNAKERR